MSSVNAIGSAAFAHRALAPYAHRLAQFLLGEDLLLSDAPCLWLGGARARDQVLEERDAWRIEALTNPTTNPDHWTEDEARAEPLRDRLARAAERYCAVKTPALSTVPVWTGEGLRPAEWMMRVFACRTPDGWRIAPGGVASVMPQDRRSRPLDFGKDVWVMPEADQPSTQVSGLLAQRFQAGHLRRTGRDLLSRVADELFWLGRNSERIENVLRVLNVCLSRYLAGNRTDAAPDVLADLAEIHTEANEALDGLDRYRDAVQRLTRDTDDSTSIPATLRTLRSGAFRARSSISSESWRYLDRLCSDRRWQATGPVRQSTPMARLIEDSIQALAAFAGSAQENLTRNYAWRFLEMGRRIERGIQIAHLADQLAGRFRDNEETYLRAWLTVSDSAAAYRARYMMTAQPAAAIDLLVLDETNPRSLAFQLAALERVLAELPAELPYRRPEHRKALSLLTDLRMMDADVLAEPDETGARATLAGFAKRCQADLAEVSDVLSRSFFAHADTPEALVSQARIETDEGPAQ